MLLRDQIYVKLSLAWELAAGTCRGWGLSQWTTRKWGGLQKSFYFLLLFGAVFHPRFRVLKWVNGIGGLGCWLASGLNKLLVLMAATKKKKKSSSLRDIQGIWQACTFPKGNKELMAHSTRFVCFYKKRSHAGQKLHAFIFLKFKTNNLKHQSYFILSKQDLQYRIQSTLCTVWPIFFFLDQCPSYSVDVKWCWDKSC